MYVSFNFTEAPQTAAVAGDDGIDDNRHGGAAKIQEPAQAGQGADSVAAE